MTERDMKQIHEAAVKELDRRAPGDPGEWGLGYTGGVGPSQPADGRWVVQRRKRDVPARARATSYAWDEVAFSDSGLNPIEAIDRAEAKGWKP